MRALLLLLCACTTARAQQTDPGRAFLLARQTGKPVLLIFSGSDWCLPCIHLEKQVLSDSTFQAFAAPRLVVLCADFPQRKKHDPRSDSLAEAYDAEGAFPKIVLLTAGLRLLAALDYHEQPVSDFIREIDSALP